MPLPSLDVVIVNWNAGHQLRACLEAIEAASRERYRLERVVVVDNASTDGSADGLDGTGPPIVLLRNDRNRGFAAACNQGAAGSRSDLLLFLNPDTRVRPDALDRAAGFLADPANRRVGLLGVQLVDDEGRVSRTCARTPTAALFLAGMAGLDRLAPRRFPGLLMSEWDHAESRPVSHVMGSFFLTRRVLFEEIDGFDEGFFVYFEDLDYAMRVRQAGHQVYFLADAQVYHRGGGTSEQVKARRLFYVLQSRLYLAWKHFGRPGAAAHAAGVLTVELAARLGRALLRRSRREFTETLNAYALLWRRLPVLVHRRFRATAEMDRP